MGQGKSSNDGSAGVGFAVLVLIYLVIKFIWWIVAAAGVVATFFVVRAIVRETRRRREVQAALRAEISARADQQHNWVMQGDDRGIFGPDGAALMRQIRPGLPVMSQQSPRERSP